MPYEMKLGKSTLDPAFSKRRASQRISGLLSGFQDEDTQICREGFPLKAEELERRKEGMYVCSNFVASTLGSKGCSMQWTMLRLWASRSVEASLTHRQRPPIIGCGIQPSKFGACLDLHKHCIESSL